MRTPLLSDFSRKWEKEQRLGGRSRGKDLRAKFGWCYQNLFACLYIRRYSKLNIINAPIKLTLAHLFSLFDYSRWKLPLT